MGKMVKLCIFISINTCIHTQKKNLSSSSKTVWSFIPISTQGWTCAAETNHSESFIPHEKN